MDKEQNKDSFYFGITAMFVKQARIWLEHINTDNKLKLERDVKYRFNVAQNGLKNLDDFFEGAIEDKEELYDISGKMSDFVEVLAQCTIEQRNFIMSTLTDYKFEKE